MIRRATLVSALAYAAALFGACADDDATALGNTGRRVVRLTDAPSLIDSIQRVDIFIERVDGRQAVATDAEIAGNVDNASAGGWVTLATPNASVDVLALRNGTTRTLHDVLLPTGSYNAFRIIDPSRSSVTLKSGRVLTHNSSPGILFPSVNRSAIRISPSRPVQIVGGRTANLIVDFDVKTSLVQRGTSIERDGLLFSPRITATVVDAGVVTATLRLVNLSRTELTLWQAGDPLTEARRLQPETDSPCMVLDIPPLELTPGQRLTLVILSVRGLPVPRFFIVPSC